MNHDHNDTESTAEGKPLSLELQRRVARIRELTAKDKISAKLVISHPTLTAAEITRELGVKPSSVTNKGPLRINDYDLMAESTIVVFSSEGKIKQKQNLGVYDSHIDWLLLLLEGHAPALKTWRAEGAEFTIKLRTDAWARTQLINLSADLLARMARLNVNFDFMVYYQNSESDY